MKKKKKKISEGYHQDNSAVEKGHKNEAFD